MKYFDCTLPTPAENLACDEALLEWCEAGGEGEILRFWEPSQPFVVVGYANRVAQEVNVAACEALKIPILRRCSGGGTVVQSAGCLNYSLILKISDNGPTSAIASTNNFVMTRNCAAILSLMKGFPVIKGFTDLAMGHLKFSGNAQRRLRKRLIFHGTFLLNSDLDLIEQVLRLPSKQPDYRNNRAHRDFLMNLEVSPAQVKGALKKIWNAGDALDSFSMDAVRQLVETKYTTAAWNQKY